MTRYIDVEKAVDIGYLSDWYQSSIDDTKPPIWTDEHLEELTNDFIIIPNDTPIADMQEVKHGEWLDMLGFDHHKTPIYQCSVCRKEVADNYIKLHKYCLHCGAIMDGGKNV